MNRELKIRLPLLPVSKLKLPVGSEIIRAEMVRDIAYLVLSVPEDAFLPDGRIDKDRYKQDEELRVYMEGERHKPESADQKPGEMPLIQIPKDGDRMDGGRVRMLGIFQTVETPATWHVLQIIKS